VPVRGLRLASTDNEAPADADEPTDEPPEPNGPSGTRPALKRVK